jgi:hypothetical protein
MPIAYTDLPQAFKTPQNQKCGETNLNGVSKRGSGAMHCDGKHGIWRQAPIRQRLLHQLRLRGPVGRRQPAGPPVLVDGGATDDP